jgi:protein MPE1
MLISSIADTWVRLYSATPVHRGGAFKGKPQNMANVPNHPPPTGYICYRCGEKGTLYDCNIVNYKACANVCLTLGHWIQLCPTNSDPTFDGRPRVKRTTGIPRSFLKTIEKPAALSVDGSSDNTGHQPSGVMVNADGDFVIAEPDKASWEQYQAKAKVSAAAEKVAAAGSKDLQDRGLECSIDKRLFVEPMKTPCCGRVYCSDCITNALVESDFVCPGCESSGVLIDDLKADEETEAKVKAYIEEKDKLKREKERSKSPSVKTETKPSPSTNSKEEKDKPTIPITNGNGVKSPTPTKTSVSPVNSKKRPAEDELENTRIPKGPAAMRADQQQQQLQVQQPQQQPQQLFNSNNAFNPMDGFVPSVPFNPHQQQFPNGNFFPQQGMNQMGYQNGNGFMAASMGGMMGMDQSIANPMMMGGYNTNGGYGNSMGTMGTMGGFQNGLYSGYNDANGNGMMGPNGGYGHSMPMPPQPIAMGGNMHINGMNGMNLNGTPAGIGNMGFNGGTFPNQQRTVFSEPFPSEEDNAYFRKPVNPHRHQARQRRVRPSDYREL